MTPSRGPSRAERTENAVEELRAATSQEAFKLRAELLQCQQRLETTEQALAELGEQIAELSGKVAAGNSSGRKAGKKKRSKAEYSEEEIMRLRAEKARTRRAAELKKQGGRTKQPAKGGGRKKAADSADA